jgi:hypothetical protein
MSIDPRFSQITRMARDYLCIQPAAVDIERVWSTLRRIFTFERSRLQMETLFEHFVLWLDSHPRKEQLSPLWIEDSQGESEMQPHDREKQQAQRLHELLSAWNQSDSFMNSLPERPIRSPQLQSQDLPGGIMSSSSSSILLPLDGRSPVPCYADSDPFESSYIGSPSPEISTPSKRPRSNSEDSAAERPRRKRQLPARLAAPDTQLGSP